MANVDIPRGTTPTIVCSLPSGIDISGAEHIYLSLTQIYSGHQIIKSDDEITVSGNDYGAFFSQEETLSFVADEPVEVQINWVFSDGKRGCTDKPTIAFDENNIPYVLPVVIAE